MVDEVHRFFASLYVANEGRREGGTAGEIDPDSGSRDGGLVLIGEGQDQRWCGDFVVFADWSDGGTDCEEFGGVAAPAMR